MRAGFDTRRRMGQVSGSVARDAVRRFFTAPRRSAAMALVVAAMAGSALTDRAWRRLRAATKSGLASPRPIPVRLPPTASSARSWRPISDKVNAEGGINGRKINLITYDDAYESDQDDGDDPQARRGGPGSLHDGDPRHEHQRRDPALSERKKGPAAFCLVGRSGLGPAARVSLDHGLPAELPGRSPHLLRSISWRTIRAARSRSSIRTTGWARNT